VLRVGSVRHRFDRLGQGSGAPDTLEVAFGAEHVENDRGVDPLPGVVQFEEVPVEKLMGFVGEVLGPYDQRDVVADVGLEQDAAQHGPLGIDIGGPFPRLRSHGAAAVFAWAAAATLA
jgi:hypothetical protein